MGKASKWFRSVLGLKKSDKTLPNSSSPKPPPTKRRWSFVKSHREKEKDLPHHHNQNDDVDPNKHAIAVAATSRNAATNNAVSYVTGGSIGIREEWAAVKIQAAFRGCLARRALRALKGLVRLQALVRGHIERKKWAQRFQRFQALLRAQERARVGWAQISELSHSSSQSSLIHQPGPATPEKFEHGLRSRSTKHEHSSILRRNSSRSNCRIIGDYDRAHSERSWEQPGSAVKNGTLEDEKNYRVLEIDTGKPRIAAKWRNLFHSTHIAVASDQYSHSFTTSRDSTTHQTLPSPSSCEVQSLTPLKFSREAEEESFCTANNCNSPQFYSATSSRGDNSKRSPFTPTKSDGSKSYLCGYSDYPNYMSCTQSSKAKLRSLSAPKQRPHYERSSSAKRYSVHGFGESKSNAQRSSTLHSNFTNKAYPGSGRLDKLGMPLGYRY